MSAGHAARGGLAGAVSGTSHPHWSPSCRLSSNPSPAQTPLLVSRPMAPSPGSAAQRVSATHPPPVGAPAGILPSKWCHHLLGLIGWSTAVPDSAVPSCLTPCPVPHGPSPDLILPHLDLSAQPPPWPCGGTSDTKAAPSPLLLCS